MHTRISVFAALFLVLAVLLSMPLAAQEPLRGLVVDRGSDALWLGFPSAAQKGMVFNVMLVPGSEVIARAKILEATPDAPYVAKASFTMLDKKAFIPIGAYVEATNVAVADRDKEPGYKAVTLGPKGPNPLSLQAGVFFPSSDELSEETDQAWPALQLNYRLCKSESTEVSLGVAHYRKRGTFPFGMVTGLRNLQVIPVTIDVKFRMSEDAKKGWYGKVGAGAFIANDRRAIPAVSDETVHSTTIGWQAALGYENKRGRSAQLGYIDARHRDFKGVTFTLGARF